MGRALRLLRLVSILTITLVCLSPQESAAQMESATELTPKIELSPLGIIIGEEYEEQLYIATTPGSTKMGLYNANKEAILPIVFDEIYSGLVNPHYVVVVENRLKGLFDVNGNRICESIYSGFTCSPADPTIISAYIGLLEKWKIINDEGEPVFPDAYTRIEFLSKGLIMLQNDDYKCSLASADGELITGFEFELLRGLSEKLADEKWYVDNDVVATALAGLQTIYINSRGERVDK